MSLLKISDPAGVQAKEGPRPGIRKIPRTPSTLSKMEDTIEARSMARSVYEPEPAFARIRKLRSCRSPGRLMPRLQPDSELDPNRPGTILKVPGGRADTRAKPSAGSKRAESRASKTRHKEVSQERSAIEGNRDKGAFK
jgi:hypothetical protein